MDKMPQDDLRESDTLLMQQIRRYQHLDDDTRVAITLHELEDDTSRYRMPRNETIQTLDKYFSTVRIIDVVERDALVIAEKKVK